VQPPPVDEPVNRPADEPAAAPADTRGTALLDVPPRRTIPERIAAVGPARVWRWLGPALVTALAAVLRLVNLQHPHTLMNHFDETYYVKDAWTLWNLGYEGRWPDNANDLFLGGDVNVFLTDPAFVVHPPLGKWLIGVGMWALGPETGWGWRITTALVGVAAVLVLILVARRLTGSTFWGCVAGFLLAIDGLGIVLSRVALLDNFLAFFVLLAFWFLLLDRDRTMTRIAQVALARSQGGREPAWGPVLWNRPWVIAAGAALGAACAVKWSGLWVLAAFGIYLVVSDALARRRAGIAYWPTDAVARQGPVTFVLLVPVAALVYLASWTGWLVTDGGYDRQSDPNPLVALWNYHVAMYNFHVDLSTPHSYASPAWQWPLMLRPTSMFWAKTDYGVDGCGWQSGCAQAVSSIANPAIWYPAVAATIALIVLFVLRPRGGRARDWRFAIVLMAIAATYVPWLLYPERTIFQFYTVVMVPFLILALVLVLRLVAGRADDTFLRRANGQGVVAVFLVIAIGFAVFWYPLWTGMEVPYDFWYLHTARVSSWI